MNEAARSQADSARRSVYEAYRDQLRFLRERLDAAWQGRAVELEKAAGDGAVSNLPAAIKATGAEAVLLLDASGATRFPVLGAVPKSDPLLGRSDWQQAQEQELQGGRPAAAAAYERIANSERAPSQAARAARAAIRCLTMTGHKEEALAAIEKYFVAGRSAQGADLDGRLIAADEQLLALHLMKHSDARFEAAARRLAGLLNHYEGDAILSAQRVFLAGELERLAPEMPQSPYVAGERVALSFLEAESARPGSAAVEASGVPGLWKLTSPNRRAIALYRTESVAAVSGRLLTGENVSRNAQFGIAPPGARSPGEAIPAGPALPGWQVWVSISETRAAPAHVAAYIWVGYLVIGGVVLAGIVLGQSFRRQSRLARMKTDLVATVSHELKTPLASMRLLVDALIEDEHVSPETAREYLAMIAGENLRLTRLIENFLTFSRIERNRQRFEFAETRPAEVVESAVQSLRERLETPGCCLEVDVPPDLPLLQADRDALITVLRNLLDNAWKYTRGEKRLAVRVYPSGEKVVFAVKDNGIGIDAREQKRIFRQFYQVDRRLARESGGCGLGLSIVDFIVRAHGGEVTVESAPGAGSTFSVWLPRGGAADEARG